jgi:hypothetical protein
MSLQVSVTIFISIIDKEECLVPIYFFGILRKCSTFMRYFGYLIIKYFTFLLIMGQQENVNTCLD